MRPAGPALDSAHLIEGRDVQDVLHIALAMEGHQRSNLQLVVCTHTMISLRSVTAAVRIHTGSHETRQP